MVRKTVKDLDGEIDELRNVMTNVRRMVEEILKRCEDLESEVARGIDENVQKCPFCGKSFANQKELKDHMKIHRSETGIFKCTICQRLFNEEWKLCAHGKSHGGIQCDMCEKNFGSEEILGKHVLIAHEKVKLYCHFYNNEKECPHGIKCIFLHEHSNQCKYGKMCERNNCMFKHEVNIVDDEEAEKDEIDDTDKVGDEIWDLNHSEAVIEVTESENVDGAEATFIYPSQTKEIECEEGDLFICGVCKHEATTKHELRHHEDEAHNWCWVCDKQFETKRDFKVHHYTVHSSSKGIWD